ncbi:hypothetical protein Dimus_026148 [Dionaea muscipula]
MPKSTNKTHLQEYLKGYTKIKLSTTGSLASSSSSASSSNMLRAASAFNEQLHQEACRQYAHAGSVKTTRAAGDIGDMRPAGGILIPCTHVQFRHKACNFTSERLMRARTHAASRSSCGLHDVATVLRRAMARWGEQSSDYANDHLSHATGERERW